MLLDKKMNAVFYYKEPQNYMLNNYFHHDIRALLSHYLRNYRKICALIGDIPAILCGYHCDITAISDFYDTEFISNFNAYINNRLYNSSLDYIAKGIYYMNEKYYYKYFICMNELCFYISEKYCIYKDSYRRNITNYYMLSINSNSYTIFKTQSNNEDIYIVNNKYINNSEIMKLITNAYNKYQKMKLNGTLLSI